MCRHMNTNEVLANRAIEILNTAGIGSGRRGDYAVVSPNDHVNMAQSTNDTFPTAMRLAALDRVAELLPVLDELSEAFAERAQAFDGVLKSGRTHAGRGTNPARPGVRGLCADRSPRSQRDCRGR